MATAKKKKPAAAKKAVAKKKKTAPATRPVALKAKAARVLPTPASTPVHKRSRLQRFFGVNK